MDQFRIINKIGEGAYSTVYTVKRLEDGEIYALKKVKIKKLSKKEKTNALNEIRILASVKSPYVIGYKESFIDENDETLCIIMEYADDGDLYQKIKLYIKNKTFFMEPDIWKIFIQITKGLNDLHEYNILHRDLKSANVFLFKDGTAKLGDLNVSKITTRGLGYTQTGTPYYASPEVWKDKPYNSKSDIWSLGCVFYELIMLTTPFRAKNMKDLFEKVKKGEYPNIPNYFSPKFQIIIDRILKVRPEERPSAEEILKMPEIVDKIIELGISMDNINDNINNENKEKNNNNKNNLNNNNNKKLEYFLKTDYKVNNRINFFMRDKTDNITSLSSKDYKNNNKENNKDKNIIEKKIKLRMNNKYKKSPKENEYSNVNKSAEFNDKKYEIFKIYNDNISYFQEKYKQKKKIVIKTILFPKKLKNLNNRLPGVRYDNNENNNNDNLNNKNKISKQNPKLFFPIHKLLPKIYLNKEKNNIQIENEETKIEINDTNSNSKNSNLYRNNKNIKKKYFLMNTLMQNINKKNPFNNKGKIDIIIEE